VCLIRHFALFLFCPQVMDTIEPGIVNWRKVNLEPKNRFKKVENANYVVQLGKQMK
jgi:hypothetical protein